MSKHVAPQDAVSPKVKAAGVWGAVVVVLGPAVAAGIAAIPKDAFDSLGVWGIPVGVFVGALGASLAAVVGGYKEFDPLREVGGAAVVAGEVPLGLPHPDAVPSDDDNLTAAEDLLARARKGGAA